MAEAPPRLDPAGRRELARLISESGLSPKEAAARLDISEDVARQWVARWYAADEAAQRFAAFGLSDEAPATAAPAAPPSASTAPASPAPAAAASGSLLSRFPRRQAAGVAMVLAFVPVGWVLSAALFGNDDTGPQSPLKATGQKLSSPSENVFRLAAARAQPGKGTSFNATARKSSIKLYRKPKSKKAYKTLTERTLDGQTLPLAFLVTKRRARAVRVQLPTRPNHARAWLRKSDVKLRSNDWHLEIKLKKHLVVTWRGDRLISRHKIGVGKSVTPTPKGIYYLSDLVKPPNPGGLYGTYAFGLSAHSNVLSSFGAGNGQIGIHGTNEPGKLGTDVSHGCIRVANDVIESFARHFPLGTPVRIEA